MDQFTQPLTHLKNYALNKDLSITSLSQTEQLIVNYIRLVKPHVIDEISNNDGIWPYYDCFLGFRFPPGLYVMDQQGFYTPIDTGHFGVSHLVRMPREITPLYGITTFPYAVVLYLERYVIIFIGCILTRSQDGMTNRFISNVRGFSPMCLGITGNQEWLIIPVPGCKPKREVSFLFSENPVMSHSLNELAYNETLLIENGSDTTSSDEETDSQEDYGDFDTN
jgi:hypothetical protein